MRSSPVARSRAPRATLLLAAFPIFVACAGVQGAYTWADAYQPPPATESNASTLGPGDAVTVHVWDNEKLTTRARVRDDGRISMPLLDDVAAAGRTPEQLARDVEARLKAADLVLRPRVTVVVEELRPVSVAVLGAVARPGTYPLERGGGVAEALASAGGPTEFAHRDRVFVLRRTPQPVRIRFTVDALTTPTGRSALFRLQPGDVVSVE